MADSLFDEAVGLLRRTLPSTHFDVRRAYRQMAERYAREGKTEESMKYGRLGHP